MENVGAPSASRQAGKTARGRSDCHFRHPACVENRVPLARRSASLWATDDHLQPLQSLAPAPCRAALFGKKGGPPVQFLTSFPSTAAMSRRTARRLVQKGGVRGSDWPFARRKNEQNPCFGR